MNRRALSLFVSVGLLLGGCAARPAVKSQWKIETEQAASVTFGKVIDIETPAGLSLWYTRELVGPVAIEFDALAVSEGGANDAVSDLNAFWMARDPTVRDGSVFAKGRSGAFAGYDDLETYYVGIGGNRNTTTRFRRYIGRAGDRPLLPEHDLRTPDTLLVPNRWMRLKLIADGRHIAVERDGRQLFALDDAEPYRSGHFALRTTQSHLRIRALRITRP